MSADIITDGMVEGEFRPAGFVQGEHDGDFNDADPNHPRLRELRELAEPDADPGQEPEAWSLPALPDHLSGTQLRRQIVTQESIDELEAARKPSLLQRLFRRK